MPLHKHFQFVGGDTVSFWEYVFKMEGKCRGKTVLNEDVFKGMCCKNVLNDIFVKECVVVKWL